MSERPKISVVIATMNRAKYLKRSLDALFQDDYPNLEVIVIDGGSSDRTVELLKSYGPRITKWVSEPDAGEYFAYNKGLKLATGEIIKCMTDDDILRPGAFGLAAEYFAANPEVELVFGQTAVSYEEGTKPIEKSPMLDPSRLALRNWLRQTSGVISIAAFIRKEVFDRIGLLSTEYFCGDMEFWARAAAQGTRMGLVPQIVAEYYFTGDNGMIRRRREIARDMVAINAKYGTTADVIICYCAKYLALYPLEVLEKISRSLGMRPLRAWRRWRRSIKPEKNR